MPGEERCNPERGQLDRGHIHTGRRGRSLVCAQGQHLLAEHALAKPNDRDEQDGEHNEHEEPERRRWHLPVAEEERRVRAEVDAEEARLSDPTGAIARKPPVTLEQEHLDGDSCSERDDGEARPAHAESGYADHDAEAR